jgi:hypothetical protein
MKKHLYENLIHFGIESMKFEIQIAKKLHNFFDVSFIKI